MALIRLVTHMATDSVIFSPHSRYVLVQAIFRLIFPFTAFLLPFGLTAQNSGKNYPQFEYKKLHFGAMLGTNTTTYAYELNTKNIETDSIQQISINKLPGAAIHIPVVSWNPHHVINVRFVSSISFHETEFVYSYSQKGKTKTLTTRTQPTCLNFPLLIKLNTKRLNNFSAYAISGASYSLDLASQKGVIPIASAPIVKLKQHEFAYHVGGGFDFYLPYFKFGFEIKLTNGINNVLIQDNTFFSSPLSSLKSKTWWFSITFEG